MSPKRAIQSTIRGFHKLVALREVPRRIALYFHELEPHQYAAFEECIAYCKGEGYEFVDAGEFVGRADGKLLFVTFDDNFRSWHDALPFLDKLGVRATFYINSLPIRGEASAADIEAFFDRIHHAGERVSLSRPEICDIAAAGHTIGCHSHAHFDLGSIPEADAKREVMVCKQILEEILDRPVTDFSFPFGMRRNFSERLRDFCLQNGFRTVCNAIPGMLHGAPSARFLNRSPWDLGRSLRYNVTNLKIDGRVFESLTGRSAVI